MADNNQIKLGTGSDLTLFHDGSHSFVQNTTGFLILQDESGVRIRSDDIRFESNGGSEGYATLTKNGSVALNFDDATKFQTTSYGIDVTGSIHSSGDLLVNDDNQKILIGGGNDLQIFHNGSDSFIKDVGTGRLLLTGSEVDILSSDAGEYCIRAVENGAVELYHDNSKKFETTSGGVEVTGNLDTDTITIPDGGSGGNRLAIGNSQDLNLYHNGSNSVILNQTGNLRIEAKSGELGVNIVPDADVALYYNGGKRFETTANGIELGLSQGSHPAGGFGGGYYSDIVINNCATSSGASGGSGVVLLSGNASWGGFIFADPQEDQAAYVKYSHGADIMYFGVDGGDRAYLENNGFKPSANNTYDLGDSTYRWRNVYTNDLNLSNEGGSNDVDGSWGDWTIQEGESDLFLKNNRSGKKYKFNLTEVS